MNKAKMLQFLKNLQSFILLLPMFSFSFLQPCLCAAATTILAIRTFLNAFHRKLKVASKCQALFFSPATRIKKKKVTHLHSSEKQLLYLWNKSHMSYKTKNKSIVLCLPWLVFTSLPKLWDIAKTMLLQPPKMALIKNKFTLSIHFVPNYLTWSHKNHLGHYQLKYTLN